MAGALSWLHGARIQRVDVPHPGRLCLTLYADGARHYLVAAFDGSGLPALVSERPRGDAAGGLAQRLRKRLAGCRLREASWRGETPARPTALWLGLSGARPGALCIVLDPRCANLVCLDDAGRAVVVADVPRFRRCGGSLGKPWAPPPEAAAPPFADEPAAWRSQALTAGGASGADSPAERERKRAQRDVRRRLKRVERKLSAIEADRARAEQAPELRERAQWLLCHLHAVPSGAAEVELPAPDGSAATQRLQLDPALTPLANAERWFALARRYERGRPIAQARHAETARERDALRELLTELEKPGADVAALLGTPSPPAEPSPRRGAARAARRRPYRSFESVPPYRVRVGRSAADNDVLTLHHARPGDLWLHVRDAPGAHVVVPCDKGQPCPDRVRLDAALLAAHFSPLAREAQVDVSVCERRHVRKRRGSPPGSVQLDRERVIALRLDPERLRWLLQRERGTN